VITTVAGTGVSGAAGDGGPATSAQLDTPNAVAPMPDGGFLIADSFNHRVRRVSPSGVITRVAGLNLGAAGDGGPAIRAGLNFPAGLAVRADGSFLIADNDNNRIRQVSASGTISTVAGTGTAGFGGDGGRAIGAQLNGPAAVAFTPDGGYLIADQDNHRVRRVNPAGVITTVAGTGVAGAGGDGGPATSAQLSNPIGLAVAGDGAFLSPTRTTTGCGACRRAERSPPRPAPARRALPATAGPPPARG
jgi:DNA-binding beta-propeller fold protein YncE